MIEQAKAENWAEVYADFDGTMLLEERTNLEQQIIDLTSEVFEERFAHGEYRVLNEGTIYAPTNVNPFEVSWVRIPPGGPVCQCTLPEADFADVYKLKALSVWLADEAQLRNKGPKAAR